MVRKFSEEYKTDAVKMVLENGVSIRIVSKDLGIGRSTLEKWVRADRSNDKEGIIPTSEREELRKLKAENHKLKLERELLKKAAVFFANERES